MSTYDAASELMKKDSPRKKKRYLLLLQDPSRGSDADIKVFERVVQAQFKEHVLVRMDDPDEALRLILIKNVDLIVIDSAFIADIGMRVEYAAELKKRKHVPILFFCESESKLVDEYRKHMNLYEELDDYVTTPVEYVDLVKRSKRMLQGGGRAAKRFQVGVPIEVISLDADSAVPAVLSDLSLVGAGITWTSENKMTRGLQVRFVVPLKKFGLFHPELGDFVTYSARITRVSIDGRTLGCELVHLTTLQSEMLSSILESIARRKRIFDKTNTPVVAAKPKAPSGVPGVP